MRQVHDCTLLTDSSSSDEDDEHMYVVAREDGERVELSYSFFLLDYVWERVLGNQYVRIVLINDGGQSYPYCPVYASRDSWHQWSLIERLSCREYG